MYYKSEPVSVPSAGFEKVNTEVLKHPFEKIFITIKPIPPSLPL